MFEVGLYLLVDVVKTVAVGNLSSDAVEFFLRLQENKKERPYMV